MCDKFWLGALVSPIVIAGVVMSAFWINNYFRDWFEFREMKKNKRRFNP